MLMFAVLALMLATSIASVLLGGVSAARMADRIGC